MISDIVETTTIPRLDDVTRFLHALHTAYPERSVFQRIGTSRGGEPLWMFSTGSGREHALVIGGPHSNEPIGLLTVIELARRLVERGDLGLTWHLIPCIDPDGVRLNEGWFDGPFTIAHHYRHLYRPALDAQPEWAFPTSRFNTPLPETIALKRAIDELRPRFLYSLHNADFGGTHFQVHGLVPGLADALGEVATGFGMPLDLAPIDTLGYEVAGPGVFVIPPYIEISHDLAAPEIKAATSWQYAQRYNTLSLLTEVPLWNVKGSDDLTETSTPRTDLLRWSSGRLRDAVGAISRVRAKARPYMDWTAARCAAVDDTVQITSMLIAMMEVALMETADSERDRVSVAEMLGVRGTVWRMPLRMSGMLLGSLTREVAAGNRNHVLLSALAELEELFGGLCAAAEREVPHPATPLRRLVAVQTEAALTTARLLREHSR